MIICFAYFESRVTWLANIELDINGLSDTLCGLSNFPPGSPIPKAVILTCLRRSISVSDQSLECLIDALYNAAVNPSCWVDFSAPNEKGHGWRICRTKFLHDFENVTSSVAHNVGLSSDGIRLYAEYYYKVDVWTARARELGKSILVATSEELSPSNEFRQTEYYNDFLRHNGIAHGLFSIVNSSKSNITGLSIYRGHKGAFSDSELEIIRAVHACAASFPSTFGS